MRPPGTYKIASRNRAFEAYLEPEMRRARRALRILESLRSEIRAGGGGEQIRIRRIFENPREIFRLELELPALGFQQHLERIAVEQGGALVAELRELDLEPVDLAGAGQDAADAQALGATLGDLAAQGFEDALDPALAAQGGVQELFDGSLAVRNLVVASSLHGGL